MIAGLPDLDRLRELLERVKEILAMGGVALALAGSFVFLLAWVLSHLRKPAPANDAVRARRGWFGTVALGLAWIPVGLTIVAAAGSLVPSLAPFVLKSFALAVIAAGFAWCFGVAAVVAGGSRRGLGRARTALLLAGTPWYCLAVYLSTLL